MHTNLIKHILVFIVFITVLVIWMFYDLEWYRTSMSFIGVYAMARGLRDLLQVAWPTK